MDIGTITGAFSAVKSIKELGKSLLDSKIDAESKQRVTEVIDELGAVQESLFYIREELLRVQDEKHVLKNRIKALEENLSQKEKLQYIKPSYWLVEESEKDGPFCQKCHDAKKLLMRLQGGKNDVWSCHECGSTYYGSAYIRPKSRGRAVYGGVDTHSW